MVREFLGGMPTGILGSDDTPANDDLEIRSEALDRADGRATQQPRATVDAQAGITLTRSTLSAEAP